MHNTIDLPIEWKNSLNGHPDKYVIFSFTYHYHQIGINNCFAGQTTNVQLSKFTYMASSNKTSQSGICLVNTVVSANTLLGSEPM